MDYYTEFYKIESHHKIPLYHQTKDFEVNIYWLSDTRNSLNGVQNINYWSPMASSVYREFLCKTVTK